MSAVIEKIDKMEYAAINKFSFFYLSKSYQIFIVFKIRYAYRVLALLFHVGQTNWKMV